MIFTYTKVYRFGDKTCRIGERKNNLFKTIFFVFQLFYLSHQQPDNNRKTDIPYNPRFINRIVKIKSLQIFYQQGDHIHSQSIDQIS